MLFTGARIAAHTGGRLLRPGPEGPVVTDTRKAAAGSWFVALEGDRFDGHSFLDAAREAGCAGAVVSRPPTGWDRGLVLVPDTLRALQDLASAVRQAFQGPVVGITGSVGKTTTRALVELALSVDEEVHATKGNLNNHVGLPLTLLACPLDATVLVLELGMNHLGEIWRLQQIARPTVRLVTNVAHVHVEGVGSLDGVAAAKSELFQGAEPGDVLCVNADDPRVLSMPRPPGTRALFYGESTSCDIRLLHVESQPTSMGIRYWIQVAGQEVSGELPAPGLHMARNLLAAYAVAYGLEKPVAPLSEALARYAPVGERMRLEPGPMGINVLNDAYNASPPSVMAALETARGLQASRRIVALGDMLELGDREVELHVEVLEAALSMGFEAVLVAGPIMEEAASRLRGQKPCAVTRAAEDLAPPLAATLRPGDLLLLKGSRGMRMERLLPAVEDLLHRGRAAAPNEG